jgi:uncharacterized protein YceK
MKAGITAAVALLATTTFSGCGTLKCCSADDQETWPIYGGVAFDIQNIQSIANQATPESRPPQWPFVIAARACDLPLSAAADTLLLPITVTYSVAMGLDRVDDAPPLSRQAWERFWGMDQPQAPPPPEPSGRTVSTLRANP